MTDKQNYFTYIDNTSDNTDKSMKNLYEQVVIDGVDVSGCEDYGYRGKAGYWCHNYDEPCSDYFDCRYKQLKRKEQECKALREEKVYTDMACEQFEQKLEKIKNIAEKHNCDLDNGYVFLDIIKIIEE